MKATFERVQTPKQIDLIVQLANTIWIEHYTSIIGKEQVTYMLETFHSAQTISEQVEAVNIYYYLILHDKKLVGYMGIRENQKSLFLSKLYLLAQERHYGIGSQAIAHIKALASSKALKIITLTVNKNNINSIKAYQKMGFKITRDICSDIGEGYVMDDYEMELMV